MIKVLEWNGIERNESKMKKRMMKMMLMASVVFVIIANITSKVQAEAPNQNEIQEQLEAYAQQIDVNNLSKEDILKIYDIVSEQYSPENIAEMIEENAEEIEEQGISKEVISAGANFIRTTDAKSIRNMIENNIDVEDIKQKINQGYTADEILNSVVQETPTEKKIEIILGILLANQIIKTVFFTLLLLFVYGTILRWCIYQKAGKPGWAAIVPVYRQIVMYQVCGLSPWLMLLWFVPILGWLAMLVIAIMKRFCLAKEFGRGSLFGFGLLFLPVIFQSILAFSPKKESSENQ